MEQLDAIAAAERAAVVVICNKLEAEIAELDAAGQREFLRESGLAEAGLNRVIRAGYELLGLHTYFTAGPKEVRAWTVPVGTSAAAAAGVIHTDFQKGFIRAEVISYEDFIAHRGEQGARDAGRWRLEGKDYVVADGDVIHFRCNVFSLIQARIKNQADDDRSQKPQNKPDISIYDFIFNTQFVEHRFARHYPAGENCNEQCVYRD